MFSKYALFFFEERLNGYIFSTIQHNSKWLILGVISWTVYT
jgi:hypothetical protein